MYSQVTSVDSLVLVNFYQALDGDNWTNKTNWLSTSPVSDWHGIEVENGRVTSINFNDNNLHGNLPSSLGDLDSLKFLSISVEENITGPIPPELGNCSNLERIDIIVTNISGEIPSSFSNLTKLSRCVMFRNNLEGTFPSFLLELPLEEIDLGDNNFTGNIPSNISDLSGLTYLDLSRNNFVGEVPATISQLTKLSTLHLRENMLVGNVESWLNNNFKLYYLSLSANDFTGSIRSSMFHPEDIVFLDFDQTNIDYIENLEELTSLQRISCGETKLNFSDIDRHASIVHLFQLFDFQNRLTRDSITLEENQELIVLSDVDGEDTEYKWYKNNVEIPDATSKNFVISNVQKEDEGWYYGEGLNYDIKIKREPIHLTVGNSTATDDLEKLDLQVFPNPTSEIIHIQGSDLDLEYLLFSPAGSLVLKGKVKDKQITLDGMENGPYVLKIASKNKTKVVHVLKI